MSEEEKQAYMQILEEKRLQAQDAAIPKYEEGLKAAQELGIAESRWVDSLRARLREISPESEALTWEIKQWVPEPSTNDKAQSDRGGGQSGSGDRERKPEKLANTSSAGSTDGVSGSQEGSGSDGGKTKKEKKEKERKRRR
jgi:hypothetical protein